MKQVLFVAFTFFSLMGVANTSHAGDASDFLRIIGAIIDASDSDHRNDTDFRRGDRGDRHRRNYGLRCQANDKGWEEHWGGHGTCRECLRKHGECVESCYDEEYQCVAEGVRHGYTQEFREYGQNRYRVEERALRECQLSGYRGCRIKDCKSNERLVSRRRC